MHLKWFAHATNHYWRLFCFEVVFGKPNKSCLGLRDKTFLVKVFKRTGESADKENRPAADIYCSKREPHASCNFVTSSRDILCLWGLAQSTTGEKKTIFFHIKPSRDAEWNGWMSSVFYFSGNGIYSSLLYFHLKQLAPEMPADNEREKNYLHIIRRISMQQLTRLYSISRTESGACIHYKHDLGFKFIQFEIPNNCKKQKPPANWAYCVSDQVVLATRAIKMLRMHQSNLRKTALLSGEARLK